MIYYIIDIRYPYGYKMITKLPGTLGKDYLYHFVYQLDFWRKQRYLKSRIEQNNL